ncbi:MAG: hypothetical protein ACPGQS_01535 [Bradymonadia bacterium]
MKRSAWVALILLGGGLGLVSYLLFGELNPTLKALGEETIASVDKVNAAVTERKETVETITDKHPSIKTMSSASVALGILKQEQSSIQQILADSITLRTLLNENKSTTAGEVRDRIFDIQGKLNRFTGMPLKNEVALPAEAAKQFSTSAPGIEAAKSIEIHGQWYDNFDTMAAKSLKGISVEDLDAKLQKRQAEASTLTTSFPQQVKLSSGLAVRIRAMKSLVMQLKEHILTVKSASKGNRNEAIQSGIDLSSARRALEKAEADWKSILDIVPKDIDRIIVDMREKSGVFEHKYRLITDGKSVTGGWVPVDQLTFRKHREHLGMTIYSKPAGVLPEDAVTTASPPGYNYIGNKRYGRWERRNGQSFWVFYGQYSLMRDLFWGRGTYRPIYRSEYRGYRSSISRRRAYYGAKKQFGTAQAIKSPKYSKSSYAKKRRSSGGFSGSKYSGSKRSGGYRSSRYRGSSFGGGGK